MVLLYQRGWGIHIGVCRQTKAINDGWILQKVTIWLIQMNSCYPLLICMYSTTPFENNVPVPSFIYNHTMRLWEPQPRN